MAKEWDKFQADYKKLLPSIKAHSEAESLAYSKRVGVAWATCAEGETNLADCAVIARKAGVTGENLADFSKNKDFKEGLQLLDKATSMLVEARRALEKFCSDAYDIATELGKLNKAITKDLAGRKDSSASKKDIEKLQDQITKDQSDLTKAGKVYGFKVVPAMLGYEKNFQKNVARILDAAPGVQAKAKDDREVPMLFVDRNIKKNFRLAAASAKSIGEHCDAALEKSQTDVKEAAPDLKAAGVLLAKLKKLNEDYVDAVKSHKDALDGSKDKAAILKMIAVIDKSYETAERQLRGTMTTIKKAG